MRLVTPCSAKSMHLLCGLAFELGNPVLWGDEDDRAHMRRLARTLKLYDRAMRSLDRDRVRASQARARRAHRQARRRMAGAS